MIVLGNLTIEKVESREVPLRIEIETLCNFLLHSFSVFTNFDPIKYVINQVFIYKRFSLTSLLKQNACDSPDELSPSYKKFYDLVLPIFSADPTIRDESTSYLVECIGALIIQKEKKCMTFVNCKVINPKTGKYFKEYYVGEDGRKHYKSEIDVVAYKGMSGFDYMVGECKRTVEGFRSTIADIYTFLNALANFIQETTGESTGLLFIVPSDRSKRFAAFISSIDYNRKTVLLSILESPDKFISY